MSKRSYLKQKVDKEWITENIIKPSWQRNLYPARINNFINHIRNGTFKSSLITVAKEQKSGKLVLLDGQHKIEAINKIGERFDMDLCIYEGLTEEEMIERYKILNDVKTPRLIDDIKLYIGKTDWLDAFLEGKFPINVSLAGGKNSLRIDKLLNILKNGIEPKIARANLTRSKLPAFIESLNSEKYSLMKEFCEVYKEVFGEPSQDSWVYRNLIVFTLMRVWIKNKESFDKETFVKVFKEIEKEASIRQDSNVTNMITLGEMTRKIYRVINKGRSVNVFEKFWDEE